MYDIDQYDQDPLLKRLIAGELSKGHIALVLGSGVSKSLGLPDWDVLLERLFALHKDKPTKTISPERQGDEYRTKYCGSDNRKLLLDVQKCLYDGVNLGFNHLRSNDLLFALGALVMASQRGSASDVITFNYDEVLERYLGYYGVVCNSVISEKFWDYGADVTVYHPHGFVPNLPAVPPDGDSLIFDQLAYDRVVGDEGKLWRQAIVTRLRSKFCIFLGLSGRDQNLSSLITRAKDTHATKERFWGIAFTTADAKAFWEDRGVYGKTLPHEEIPAYLLSICQEAARIR